jgi:predicted transcriptional regulator
MDNKGIVDYSRLRTDGRMHPTILKDAVKQANHNDLDCIHDLEDAGFIENKGTGTYPVVKLTEKGLEAFKNIMRHKQNGGSFGNFPNLCYGP